MQAWEEGLGFVINAGEVHRKILKSQESAT